MKKRVLAAVSALIMAFACMTACGNSSSTSDAKSSSTPEGSSSVSESTADSSASSPESVADSKTESKSENSSTTTSATTTTTSDAKESSQSPESSKSDSGQREYNGKVLTFSVPSNSVIEAYDNMAMGLVFMLPKKTGANYFSVDEDAKEGLDFYYETPVSNASAAAEICFKSYVDTGYEVSTEVGKRGAVGKYNIQIDGKQAFVVWHVGSGESASHLHNFDCFVDSPAGTIVHLVYTITDQTSSDACDFIIKSIKFK